MRLQRTSISLVLWSLGGFQSAFAQNATASKRATKATAAPLLIPSIGPVFAVSTVPHENPLMPPGAYHPAPTTTHVFNQTMPRTVTATATRSASFVIPSASPGQLPMEPEPTLNSTKTMTMTSTPLSPVVATTAATTSVPTMSSTHSAPTLMAPSAATTASLEESTATGSSAAYHSTSAMPKETGLPSARTSNSPVQGISCASAFALYFCIALGILIV